MGILGGALGWPGATMAQPAAGKFSAPVIAPAEIVPPGFDVTGFLQEGLIALPTVRHVELLDRDALEALCE